MQASAYAAPPEVFNALPTHTPGPWKHHSHGQVGPEGATVCEVWSAIGADSEDAISQSYANIHLISAAPDLLSALEKLLAQSGLEYWPVEQEMARAAIAKARGLK